MNISLPITADSNFTTGASTVAGQSGFRNTVGATSYSGGVFMVSGAANQASIQITVASGSYSSTTIITSAVPFTFVTGDTIWWNMYYKAA
jgi:autotransporter translocation and assembly factor TamB